MKLSVNVLPGSDPGLASPFPSREGRPSGLPLRTHEASAAPRQEPAEAGGADPQTKQTRAAESSDEPDATAPELRASRSKPRGSARKDADEFQQLMALAFSSSRPKPSAPPEPEAEAGKEADFLTALAPEPDATARLDLLTLVPLCVPINLQQEVPRSPTALAPGLVEAALKKATLTCPTRADRSGGLSLPEPRGAPLLVGEPTEGTGEAILQQVSREMPVPARLPPTFGTTGAEHTYDMTNTAESGPMAIPTGQLLPVNGEHLVTIASAEPLATASAHFSRGGVSEAPPVVGSAHTAADIASFMSFSPSHGLESTSAPLVQESMVAPASSTTPLEMEIHSRVLEFRRLNADSMAVVVRPDAHTEIHLSLRLSGGQVDVSAHWTRGDASLIRAQWSQMQESLASQGVRLSAVPEVPTASGLGQSLPDGFHNSNHQPGTPREQPGLEPAVFVPAATKPSSRATARSHQPLLESWA